MSAAKPKGSVWRATVYLAQRPDAEFFTHAQGRHMRRKDAKQAKRPVPGWKPQGAKGRPTPRRADARAARLEARRG